MDSDIPSIRFMTLRHLVGHPADDTGVEAAWRAVRTTGPVVTILAGQTEAGNWAHERSYYTPKYTSTHWSMLLLAELAADGRDPRLRHGARYMLDATEEELVEAIRQGTCGLSCFWGNLLRYAVHCGYRDDPRVAAAVRYLVHDGQEGGWRCRHNDGLACAWGAARALWGLAGLHAGQRTSGLAQAIESGLALLLEHHRLVEADYPTSGRVHPLWFRLNFPLFYQADVLFVLRVLAELDALDHPGARAAVAWLSARRGADGRWRGASPYQHRTWPGLGGRENTDRWVSLQAAMVLRAGYSS
jgi:hypothetical protein